MLDHHARMPQLSYHLICLFDMFPFICLTRIILSLHTLTDLSRQVFSSAWCAKPAARAGWGDLQPVRSRSIFAWRLAIWVHLAGPKQAAIGGRVGCGPLGAEGAV